MKYLHRFFRYSLYIMATTLLHHLYGAIIYPQKFRIYTALFAVPIMLTEYLAYKKYQKDKRKVWKALFEWIAILIPLLAIGLYEGGYNHVLKNILFFSGTKRSTLTKLFPPPAYEMPDNFIFEATGVLQFALAIPAIIFLVKYYLSRQ